MSNIVLSVHGLSGVKHGLVCYSALYLTQSHSIHFFVCIMQCQKVFQRKEKMNVLWQNSSPMVITVLTQTPGDKSLILLERWTVEAVDGYQPQFHQFTVKFEYCWSYSVNISQYCSFSIQGDFADVFMNPIKKT